MILRSKSGVVFVGLAVLLGAVGCAGGDDAADSEGDSGSARRAGGGTNSEAGLPVGTAGTSEVLIRRTGQTPDGGDGTGAFRTTCEFSHMRHDDPIVFPRRPGASHLHVFFGNTDADAASTAASLLDSGNSTCRGGVINRTSYWVPALLDDTGEPQVPETANFYYKSGYRGIEPELIEPFPEGLRMIAGDGAATAEQANEAGYWTCDSDDGEHSGSIPDCAVGGRLLMHVEFPQCWDGKNLDSSDHKSHMAYPVNGSCPASHRVAIPAITYNIPYRVPRGGTDGWRLASDAYAKSRPGGFSAHGDWFDGWDADVVEVWVRNCVSSGMDCHSHLLGDGREIYFDDGSAVSD